MYTQLKSHKDYILTRLKKPMTDREKRSLLKYHVKRVRDYQHERLIHLLVTFFFGVLFIAAFLAWAYLPPAGFTWPATALVVLLFVLEFAYVIHYYRLENGVQSLYELTEKLGKN